MRCKISRAPLRAVEIIHLHAGTQRRHKSRVKCVFIANETQTTQHRGACRRSQGERKIWRRERFSSWKNSGGNERNLFRKSKAIGTLSRGEGSDITWETKGFWLKRKIKKICSRATETNGVTPELKLFGAQMSSSDWKPSGFHPDKLFWLSLNLLCSYKLTFENTPVQNRSKFELFSKLHKLLMTQFFTLLLLLLLLLKNTKIINNFVTQLLWNLFV